MSAKIKSYNLTVTDFCNKKCFKCSQSVPEYKERSHRKLEDIKRALDKLKEWGLLWSPRISGGEPALHPELIEICRYADKLFGENSSVRIYSNEKIKINWPDDLKNKIEIIPQDHQNWNTVDFDWSGSHDNSEWCRYSVSNNNIDYPYIFKCNYAKGMFHTMPEKLVYGEDYVRMDECSAPPKFSNKRGLCKHHNTEYPVEYREIN